MLLRLLTEEKNWPAARAVAVRYQARSPDQRRGVDSTRLHHPPRAKPGRGGTSSKPRAPCSPNESVIPYNLACYACQSGDLDRARTLLQEAPNWTPKPCAFAAEDEDLRALWPELEDP
jgi:hypothetical protein